MGRGMGKLREQVCTPKAIRQNRRPALTECTLHRVSGRNIATWHPAPFPAVSRTAARPVRYVSQARMIASLPMRLLKRKDRRACALPVRWPSADGWLPVAREAVRAAHAAHCAATVLQGKSSEDAAQFLTRRAGMLLQLLESLITESRCEDRLRHMSCDDVLQGMKQAEEQLLAKVQQLLAGPGLKLQMAKLLEHESLIGQASLARIQLALMENEKSAAT